MLLDTSLQSFTERLKIPSPFPFDYVLADALLVYIDEVLVEVVRLLSLQPVVRLRHVRVSFLYLGHPHVNKFRRLF